MHRHSERDLALGWRGLLLTAIILLLATNQASLAQEARGEAEISIVVHPGESPSGNYVPPGSSAEPHGSGASGETHDGTGALRFGTLSSLIVSFPVTPASDPWTGVLAVVVVRDDRGTASGWDAYISDREGASRGCATLIENRTSTIRRIQPANGAVTNEVGQVRGGLSLGPLAPPVSLLHASPGAGSGVYLQQVLIAPGPNGDSDVTRSILIQLPEGP